MMKPRLMPDFLNVQDSACLSIYLPRVIESEESSNMDYLRQVRAEVCELLRWSYESDAFKHFLSAIDQIQENPGLAINRKDNIAIFITKDGQWDFRFSGYCKPFFSLANSFHIKPLLRYFHRNKKFFVLCFGEDKATLYVDGPERLKALDSIVYPAALQKGLKEYDLVTESTKKAYREQFEDFSNWISDWVSQDLIHEEGPLLVAGVDHLTHPFTRNATYKSTFRDDLGMGIFDNEAEFFKNAKMIVRRIADGEEKKAVSSFNRMLLLGFGSTYLPQIAKQAVQGNISLLLVAREDHIWGELNRITGDVQIHHEQLTDLDDDLLDDLAEVVLGYKCKVLVLDKNCMPGLQPIAAIFKKAPKNFLEHKTIIQPIRVSEKERMAAI